MTLLTRADGSPALVGVLGAGVMGIGVAQVAAEAGHPVTVVDTSDELIDDARSRLRASLTMTAFARRERPRPDARAVTERILFTTDPTDVAESDLVIENVTEVVAVKEPVYRALDEVLRPGVVVAANTSCIPVGRIASWTSRPGYVIGTHFMNPVPLRDTVEVIRGGSTAEATLETTLSFLTGIGMQGIVVGDGPGFVSNRVLMLTLNEAARVADENSASPTDIDLIFTKCMGHAMGPLATADLIGLDTVVLSLEVLRDELDDPRFEPAEALRRRVKAGQLGRKSGEGFHRYGAMSR